MNMRAPLSVCLLLLTTMCTVAAEPASPTDTAIRALGRDWLTRNPSVGLTIGVYDNGKRSFYNFGVTQIDGNRIPTKDTVYEIGSIGKTMTGQLLARAIVEGRAALNDEAEKYLPEPYPNLAGGGEKIRLLHLANMTSQLADNIPDLTQVRMVPGEVLADTRMRVLEKYTQKEFLQQLRRVVPRREPGSEPSHSNVASMLLGVVLEKIYGKPFQDILASEIEKPLRMGSGVSPNAKLLARGYTKDGEEVRSFDAPTQYAAGSLRYSADDLLKFATWQVVEPDASTKLAHEPTWFTLDKKTTVSFYWIGEESPHGRRLRYSGGTFGFASVCALYPASKVAVVLLSNRAADDAQETLRTLSANIVDLLRPGENLSPPSSSEVAPQTSR
jgi:D-alanyl-D-alanine-carboxypeptidase/D-alanyl-D-alanine-endopeptidase